MISHNNNMASTFSYLVSPCCKICCKIRHKVCTVSKNECLALNKNADIHIVWTVSLLHLSALSATNTLILWPSVWLVLTKLGAMASSLLASQKKSSICRLSFWFTIEVREGAIFETIQLLY